jgi:hypothetical protein
MTIIDCCADNYDCPLAKEYASKDGKRHWAICTAKRVSFMQFAEPEDDFHICCSTRAAAIYGRDKA